MSGASIAPQRGVAADSGHGQAGGHSPPPAAELRASEPEAAPSDDYRLIIEPDPETGGVVYKTLDRRTGCEVASRRSEQIEQLAKAATYVAGDIIKARA